jgi:hypothetical protein
LSAAVEAALRDGQRRPPEGVSPSDWDRVREVRAADPTTPVATLRRLGPTLAQGEMLLVLDEVLTRAREQDQFHELRTACLLTAEGRRYLSGRGPGFLRQVRAAVQACCARSLLVVGEGAKKCRELAARICPEQDRRRLLVRRLLRALWGGHVPRAVRVLTHCRRQAADREAVDTLCTYLEARAVWIPDYRTRRRQRRYIGSGLGEKANDRLVVRRQKRRGIRWAAKTTDALAALRTLQLNDGWDPYWQERRLLPLTAA